MAGIALGALCIGLVIGIPIAALIFMGGVSLANMCLSPPRRRSSYYDDDDDYDDDWEPRPRRRRRRGSGGTAIPMPNFGQAILIVIVSTVINAVIGFVIGFVFGRAGMAQNNAGLIVLQAFNAVIGFLVFSSVAASMLPISFPRACLAVTFAYLIAIAIGIVCILPAVLMGGFR